MLISGKLEKVDAIFTTLIDASRDGEGLCRFSSSFTGVRPREPNNPITHLTLTTVDRLLVVR